MRTLAASFLILLLALANAWAQPATYVSPNVPATPDGATFLPWEVASHQAGASPDGLARSLPGHPTIDALHKMDKPDNWLFSVDAPSDLAAALAAVAEPRDVIRYDAGTYSLFFDGSCTSPAIALSSSLDAIYLDGTDTGDLIASFNVPTTLGATTYQPNQLVRYQRTGSPPCGWTLTGLEMDLSFGTYFPTSAKVTGADRASGQWFISLDIPTDVGPPGPVTRTPGQIVSTDGTTWTLFEDLQASGTPGWPISSIVDALSCEANPGRIDTAAHQLITMDKGLPSVTINCPGSCSSGGTSYGLYEGTTASLQTGAYNHVKMSCVESCPGSITFSPTLNDTYYLIIPHNGTEEGSYGLDSGFSERPQAATVAGRCMETQNLTPCP